MKMNTDFNPMRELNIGLLAFSSLVTMFLYFGTVTDQKRKIPFMRHFSYLLFTNIIMQTAEIGICIFDGSNQREILYLFLCLSYGGGAVLMTIYTYCLTSFIKENAVVTYRLANIVGVVCAVYLVMILTSPFTGAVFTIDAGGYYQEGILKEFSFILDPVVMVVVIILTLRYRKTMKVKGILYLVSICVLTIPTMLLWDVWYPEPEYMMMTLYFIMVFLLFHKEMTILLVKKEKEMAESKITTAISQIQPHFIFNSLSTIKFLVKKDPMEALEAIDEFSDYLRGSMNSLTRTCGVPFSEELELVNHYLYMEKKRFGDNIHIEYDIQLDGFLVPALSVQPIVENAVKHGIREKLNGGTIVIETKEDAKDFIIQVTDDGAGFDPQDKKEDGKSHVGIANVQKRLALMCEGTLEIESAPQKGCQVTIRIPKRKGRS